MPEKSVGKIIPLALLKKHKINKIHIKKLTVTECKNLKKAVDENEQAGGPGCGVCCTVP
jgi:hypothetical protein